MRRLRLLPLVLGLTLVGCAGPAPAVQAPAADPQRLEALQKGLTAAQVRELAGEPLEIKP
jgi:outer membrane protein assembly factor BamE (lipoprotein component of BamABCDE complex)